MSQDRSLIKLMDLEDGTSSSQTCNPQRRCSARDTPETTSVGQPPRSPCRIDARIYMSAFFCGTVALTTGHHFYYHYLDGSRVGRIQDDEGYWVPNPGKDWTTQPIVNAAANIFTKSVVLCVSCLAWVAFTQIFWRNLATQGCTLRDIDSLMRFRVSVTNIPVWPVFRRMLGLLLVAFCAAAADFMTAFIPGSLIVSEGFTQDACTVPVPDISRAQFIQSTFNPSTPASLQPNRNALSLATSVSLTGTYLVPFTSGDTSSYEVTYLAPRLQCDNVTQSTNISDFLPVRPDGISVWYAAADQGPTQASFVIVARNLDDGSASSPLPPVEQLPSFALRCTLWSSTYTVNLDVDNGPDTAAVVYLHDERQITGLDDVLGTNGSVAEQQMFALWLAFTEQLSGNVTYIPEMNLLNSTNNLLSLTSITKGTLPNSRQWDVREWGVELLMKNMALSLSSISSGAFPDDSPYATYETTCGFPGLKYEYFVANLWGPYGGVIFLAAVCLIWGWVARQKNARNETLDFSRVLSAYPRNEHGMEGLKLTPDTWVTAMEDGHLMIR